MLQMNKDDTKEASAIKDNLIELNFHFQTSALGERA